MKTLVIAVPRLETHRPPPGPAIVANVCALQGHDVSTCDLNIELLWYCKSLRFDYHSFDGVFDLIKQPTPEQEKIISDFVEIWARDISSQSYDYIMYAVFGRSGLWFAERFLKVLRPLTKATIVAGGMGVGTLSLTNAKTCFGEKMKDQGLINDYIVGEAEHNLIKYFKGETGPGINNTDYSQIEDIENLPEPDYGYFDLDKYEYLYPGEREVFITGSRGCVRKCTYCDVERYWPKYRYRSGKSISDEIIRNYEKFGVTRFYFTDSLVNGSLKVFADMCDKLAQYKFEKPISWSGQFIFRQKNTIPKDHFATMSAAGANILFVGIETGSDRVRKDMGKNFTNEDIDFQLEECSRYGIKIIPLTFTGYLTETLDDHLENLKMFKRWQRFVADGTIIGIELGSNLKIYPGAPVENMIESHDISFMLDHHGEPDIAYWQSGANPNLTIREQVRRKAELHYTAIKYNWPVWRQHTILRDFENRVRRNKLWEDQHDFYKIVTGKDNKKTVIPINAN